jgi:REP element-mobilizing transposase RayT
MGRPKRAEQFSALEVGLVHVCSRCVRRSYLAGLDVVSGKDYGYRREWIRRRMELLCSVFALDMLTYAIMSNHIHLILRTRPDVTETWTDEEIAFRWLRVFPGQRIESHLADPTDAAVEMLVNTPGKIKQLRTRLTDVSWFMKALCEPIARQANAEDDCTGRFWEGRFKAQKIVDEAGLLACAMYVDLNPVRAAIAQTPEASHYTSAFDRINGARGETKVAAACEPANLEDIDQQLHLDPNYLSIQQRLDLVIKSGNERAENRLRRQLQLAAERVRAKRAEQLKRVRNDAWLAPLEMNERGRPGPKAHRDGVRASDKGFLAMSLGDYLKLLDWTGRQGRPDKRGKIPSQLRPLLQRVGIESEMWCDLVWNFKRYFSRSSAAGRPESLQNEAERSQRQWIPGQRRAAACFAKA